MQDALEPAAGRRTQAIRHQQHTDQKQADAAEQYRKRRKQHYAAKTESKRMGADAFKAIGTTMRTTTWTALPRRSFLYGSEYRICANGSCWMSSCRPPATRPQADRWHTCRWKPGSPSSSSGVSGGRECRQ